MIYSLIQFTIMVWRFIHKWTDPILEYNDPIAAVNVPLESINQKYICFIPHIKYHMNSEDLGYGA